MKKSLLSIALCLVSLQCQAGFNEGVTAYEKGDYAEALKAWKTVAEQKPAVTGDFEWHSSQSKNTVEAQYGLALLYWQGKGVAQNYQEAEKWLKLAATSGHSEAQLKLAYLYLEGLSGKANPSDARKWFEQSAQQGNVNAQYNLGLLYWNGLGVQKDASMAKKWLTAAAAQGDASAKELLAEMNAAPVQTAAVSQAVDKPVSEPAETSVQPVASINTPQTVNVQTTPTAVVPNIEPTVTSTQQPTQAVNTPITPPVPTSEPAVSTVNNIPQTVDAQTAPPVTPMTDYYAVQLIGSAKQSDTEQFIATWRDKLSPLIATDKIKKSERIFIVAYGNYSSPAEAKQAIAELPAELRKSKPWVVKMHGDSLVQ